MSWHSSVPPARRLRRDAEHNRELILQAAREVFAARGPEVTLHEVARHAGLGVGTVYRRFCNRGELIDALVEEYAQRLLTLADDALVTRDPWEGFVAFLEGCTALMAADRGLRAMMTSSTQDPRRVAEIRARFQGTVTELIARAQRAGQLRADLDLTDLAVLNVILGASADFTAAAPETWRRYLTLVLDGLRAERAAPSPLPAPPLSLAQLDQAMTGWRWPTH